MTLKEPVFCLRDTIMGQCYQDSFFLTDGLENKPLSMFLSTIFATKLLGEIVSATNLTLKELVFCLRDTFMGQCYQDFFFLTDGLENKPLSIFLARIFATKLLGEIVSAINLTLK
jgi:hypothetical protein